MQNSRTALLSCEGLTKSFSGVRVLKGVALQVRHGSVLGLIGENGAGKSTLMNIIGGVHKPDSGEMSFEGRSYHPAGPLAASRAGVAFVHQELNLFDNLSIADNIFITGFPGPKIGGLRWIRRSEAKARTASLLERIDLQATPDTPVETLAQGERQLVEIAKALETKAKLIIFDEPTTSLSRRETQRLFATIEKLRASGLAMVYISHALEDVRALCDQVAILRDGEVVGSGPTEDFPTERLITLMVGRSIDQLYPPRTSVPSSEAVLVVQGVCQPGVVEDVTFQLGRGEVLGFAGLMGSGRSELARILFGLDPYAKGEVRVDGLALGKQGPRERIRLGMAMLTESRRDDGLYMDASILENMVIVHAQPGRVQEMCSSLRVSCVDVARQPVKQLSGGNQQKVALGKWLVKPPRVLILDEPTRGIDVGAKYEIYRIINQLAEQGVAVLMISSEIEELMGMCDRILVMRKGQIAGEFAKPFDREQLLGVAV